TSVTIATADSTQDRYDLISADSAGIFTATTGALGSLANGTCVQPDTSDTKIAYIPVAAGITAIQNSDIQDVRTFVDLKAPTNSMAYTFLSTALSNADPGIGKCGFDSTTNSSIAHLYISYTSPSAPQSIKSWFFLPGSGTPPLPYFLRFWS